MKRNLVSTSIALVVAAILLLPVLPGSAAVPPRGAGQGPVAAWGSGEDGALGNGYDYDSYTPIRVLGVSGVTRVAAGYRTSLALKDDGTVWAWGFNDHGQLGDGTTNDRFTPVQVSGLAGVVAIAAGYSHSLAVKGDGTVWAWGRNDAGQLGDGTTNDRHAPIQVSGLTGAVAIAGGFKHSLAVKSNGTVRAWGENGTGQLGDGTQTNSVTPVQVLGLTGAIAVAAGSNHSLALRGDTTVRAWGNDSFGQLGDNKPADFQTVPVQVKGTGGSGNLNGAAAVAAGNIHSLAVMNDGTARAWGDNSSGQLGDGTTTRRLTPVQVSGLTGAVALAGGSYFSLAALSDGTARGWGTNGFGELGDGTQNDSLTPVKALGLTGVEVVAAGVDHSLATPSNIPFDTWYLAEGTTDWGFETYISIENPNNADAAVKITYMTAGGEVPGDWFGMPPMSRNTINPKFTLGAADFSTKVECTNGFTIAVDRTMSWQAPGASSPEGHCSVGVTSPATTWYLPEGSSNWGFETFLLIQNPNPVVANCLVTYMIEGEGSLPVPHQVPANGRATFPMVGDIGQKDASIKVESDVPVIPERAMYRNGRREGHDSIGTTTPATDYYLAEGTTAWGFTTFVLVQNPNPTPTDVTLTYMTSAGPVVQPTFQMPANSRQTIRVNAALSEQDCSTKVHGSQPIIAERAMYWDNGLGEACHDSIGMDAPHTNFYLPDGQTVEGRETFTLVQNPNDTPVDIEVYYLPEGGPFFQFADSIPANSRKTYNMAEQAQVLKGSILVISKTPGKKIMCERAMYWYGRGAGTDTIGGYSD